MSWKLPQRSSNLSGPNHRKINPGNYALPNRLFELLLGLPKSPRLLDIGADHGLLALSALRLGITDNAWAIDRRKGPLDGAIARTLQSSDDCLSFVLSDGLAEITTRSDDVVVVAGMSGENASTILENARLSQDSLPSIWAFQVNDGHEELRRTLVSHGFVPLAEWFVAEAKRFFLNQVWMQVGHSPRRLSDMELLMGPLSLSGRTQLLEVWVQWELARIDVQLEGIANSSDGSASGERVTCLLQRRALLTGASACH